MKKDKSERNKTALQVLSFALISGSIVLLTGWAHPGRHFAPTYYKDAIDQPLGALFLFLAFLTILIPYIRRKIKNKKNQPLIR